MQVPVASVQNQGVNIMHEPVNANVNAGVPVMEVVNQVPVTPVQSQGMNVMPEPVNPNVNIETTPVGVINSVSGMAVQNQESISSSGVGVSNQETNLMANNSGSMVQDTQNTSGTQPNNVILTTNNSQPFDISSMFANNNQ